jgi:hypothetical protein
LPYLNNSLRPQQIQKLFLQRALKIGKLANSPPPAGGFLDLTTGLYVPPPPGSEFDPNTGVFIPPSSLGTFDPSTGQYQAPVGFQLDSSGQFIENPEEAGEKGDNSPSPPLPKPNSFGDGSFGGLTGAEGILTTEGRGSEGNEANERAPSSVGIGEDLDLNLVVEEDDVTEVEEDSDLEETLDDENDPSSSSDNSSSEGGGSTTLDLCVTVQY